MLTVLLLYLQISGHGHYQNLCNALQLQSKSDLKKKKKIMVESFPNTWTITDSHLTISLKTVVNYKMTNRPSINCNLTHQVSLSHWSAMKMI